MAPPRKIYLGNQDEATHRAYLRGIWQEDDAIFTAVANGNSKAAALAARLHMTNSLNRRAERLKR